MHGRGIQMLEGKGDNSRKRATKEGCRRIVRKSCLEQGAKEPLRAAEDGKGGFSGRVLRKRRTQLRQEPRSEAGAMERQGGTGHAKNPVDECGATRYSKRMIGSFRHRGLKRFFEEEDPRKLPPDMVDRIKAILARLHQAEAIEDMNVHSYRLHLLKGSRKGEWSVRVKTNWRMIFRFEEGSALDVNFEDYH